MQATAVMLMVGLVEVVKVLAQLGRGNGNGGICIDSHYEIFGDQILILILQSVEMARIEMGRAHMCGVMTKLKLR